MILGSRSAHLWCRTPLNLPPLYPHSAGLFSIRLLTVPGGCPSPRTTSGGTMSCRPSSQAGWQLDPRAVRHFEMPTEVMKAVLRPMIFDHVLARRSDSGINIKGHCSSPALDLDRGSNSGGGTRVGSSSSLVPIIHQSELGPDGAQRPQFSSASRLTASLAGFLLLRQCGERPDR